MLSLRQILALHSPLLLIDSSSGQIQVGLWTPGREAAWKTAEIEAGTGVFAAAEQLLAIAQLNVTALDAFIFCAGPGSVLGIRTAAVAIRTWNAIRPRPVYSFGSLATLAHFEKQKNPGRAFSVIADARRESWHEVQVDLSGNVSALRRVPASALSGALLTPAHFRSWATPPPQAQTVAYNVAAMTAAMMDGPLFSENSDPDAFLHETPTYLTWTPQIHRAPNAS